jgi:DNA-binding MltR family transcriptional regulator
MAIVGEIRSQSDRGATILAASVISTFLEKAILTKLTPTSNRRRVKLFRGFGPLSTLSSRIEIAYSLGLFDEDYYGRLNAIKDIRNEFAHSIVPLTFQSENIRKLCMKLNFKIEPPISTEREQFLESVAEFLCVLTEMPVPGFS